MQGLFSVPFATDASPSPPDGPPEPSYHSFFLISFQSFSKLWRRGVYSFSMWAAYWVAFYCPDQDLPASAAELPTSFLLWSKVFDRGRL